MSSTNSEVMFADQDFTLMVIF